MSDCLGRDTDCRTRINFCAVHQRVGQPCPNVRAVTYGSRDRWISTEPTGYNRRSLEGRGEKAV